MAKERTYASLYAAAAELFADTNSTSELFEIQDLWTRDPIRTDEQVENLPCWAELQGIFVPRNHPHLRKGNE
jgi:hypothetical protein